MKRRAPLALLLAATAVVSARHAVASPVEAGLTVAGVRLDADPVEAARLWRYVTVARGAPYDPEQVRDTVELLHATGEFEDVRVEVEEAPTGLTVVIQPVPAALLGLVTVEGQALLDEKELRAITRLRHGDALAPERLDRAARDVAVALVARGYLEARASARLLTRGRAAHAVFLLTPGARVRVGAASVQAEPALARLLAPRVEPDPGEPFERSRSAAAAESMRRLLVEQGRWRATVAVGESYDPARAALSLRFVVTAGPVMSVRVQGTAVPRKVRERVARLLREGAASADAVEEGRDILEEELRARGHRRPTVRPVEVPGADGMAVVYAIDPGPAAIVSSVRVAGEAPPEAVALLRTRASLPLRDADLVEDERTLLRALEERGHAGASVKVDAADGGGPIPVRFEVVPGPMARVAAVTVEVPAGAAAVPAPPLRLVVGLPYRLADVAHDRSALLAAYREGGHLAAEVVPEIDLSKDRAEARVTLRVTPGQVTRVERVVIAGMGRTREEVLRRELLIVEGKPLALQQLTESQRRLAALGLFETVSLSELDPEDAGHRTVVVRVQEAPRTSVAYGIGYGERDLLRGSVEVTRRNLFGLDRRLSGFVRMSFRGSRFLASYREPYLFGRRQELFVSAYRDEEDREEFDYARYGLTVQTVRSLTARWNLVLRQTFQEIRTFNLAEDCLDLDRQFCPATVSGPSASLVHDTRDDPLDPRRGHLLVTDAQLSHRLLGGDTLVKGYVQASAYRLLAPRVTLALAGRLGLGRTFGEEPFLLPVPERFFAGGDYSLRGFGVDDVRREGGNGLLVGSVELRVAAASRVQAAVFTDVGNVYRLASEIDPGEMRRTAGLGLRYKSALGPLRLDWGYKLDRQEGESASHVHLTIGHAF